MIYSKIKFDYSSVDLEGLDRGETAIDYEFCIPADSIHLNDILAIEPNAKVFKTSKGRIGCSREQWMCVVSTRNQQWKEKLIAIATLPYIGKIQQTFYE